MTTSERVRAHGSSSTYACVRLAAHPARPHPSYVPAPAAGPLGYSSTGRLHEAARLRVLGVALPLGSGTQGLLGLAGRAERQRQWPGPSVSRRDLEERMAVGLGAAGRRDGEVECEPYAWGHIWQLWFD
uniref:Uncharacterized protein n=1 Tax=Oryza brachyantha TaxID=4533 RepID=J3LZV5_ORYBR